MNTSHLIVIIIMSIWLTGVICTIISLLYDKDPVSGPIYRVEKYNNLKSYKYNNKPIDNLFEINDLTEEDSASVIIDDSPT